MTNQARRWLSLAGGCVLASAVAIGAAGCGTNLSQLKPGQCISGNVEFYPPGNIKVINCSKADPIMDYKVAFTESATGDSYPGNLDSIAASCEGQGGRFLSPSSDTWDKGDRVALCYKPPFMGTSG